MISVGILLVILTSIVLYSAPRILELWRYMKKARKLPAPKGLPILGNVLDVLLVPSKRLTELAFRYIDECPKLFTLWLGPMPIVFIINPKLIEQVLGSSKHIDKPNQYQFLEPWLGTGLLTSTGSKWHSHRKMLTPAFHFSVLENFTEVFSQKSQILVKKLEKQITLEDIDIFPIISRCTLDVICETAMGVSINAQDAEQESEYIKAVCGLTDDVMKRFLSPWLYPDFIYNLTPSGKKMKRRLDILHSYSKKVIQERKASYKSNMSNGNVKDEDTIEGKKRRLAFLDLLLEASENGTKLTDEEIREEVDTFMFEGHDTTAAAISWTLRQLAEYPNFQEEAYEELESIFQGSDRLPTFKDLNNMKYLERIIKEGLRRFPSVPLIGRILKEEIEFDGYTIPAGIRVGILPAHTMLLPEYYEDNYCFNPDHFLPENIAKRHPYAYIPFSAGPRNCIGQKFALLEEKAIISAVIRNFKFEPVGEDPEPVPELIIRPDIGIHLKLTKREKSI